MIFLLPPPQKKKKKEEEKERSSYQSNDFLVYQKILNDFLVYQKILEKVGELQWLSVHCCIGEEQNVNISDSLSLESLWKCRNGEGGMPMYG